MHILLDN